LIPPGWESIPGLSLQGLQIGSLSSWSCCCILEQDGAVYVILPCRQRKSKSVMPLTRAGHRLWKKSERQPTPTINSQQPTTETRQTGANSNHQPKNQHSSLAANTLSIVKKVEAATPEWHSFFKRTWQRGGFSGVFA